VFVDLFSIAVFDSIIVSAELCSCADVLVSCLDGVSVDHPHAEGVGLNFSHIHVNVMS
jgi:hypothetical protein